MKIEKGMKAPDFTLPDQKGVFYSLEQFRGKKVVLYFYPKDNTPGCTREAKEFSDLKERFEQKDVVIIGISPDSSEKHRKFVEKHQLSILLLSDEKHEVLEKYGVWQLKKMMGREYMGVVRTTFLIDKNGQIENIWEKVKVSGHVDNVFKQVCDIS